MIDPTGVSEPITTSPPDPPLDKLRIKGTARNFKRHSAMLFGGVVSIGLALMVVMVSLQPEAELRSQADSGQFEVKVLPQLIEDCQFNYQGCHDPEGFVRQLKYPQEAQSALLTISQEYNLNPQLLLTLYLMSDAEVKVTDLDPQYLEEITGQLVRFVASTSYPMATFTHPNGTIYQAGQTNQHSLIVINYLASKTDDKQTFEISLGLSTSSTGQKSFQEIFTEVIDLLSF